MNGHRQFLNWTGISVSGPSSLLTLLDAIPPYWTTTRALYTSRVGDPATEEGAALLRTVESFSSPLRRRSARRRVLEVQ